ncbi:MAG: hypothetical protein FWF68_04210 [Spirochaetes bacterium]|nr:hypothetical protein [Spirochaetota bacterium]
MIHFTENYNKKIFTTGAFLQPIQVKDANGNDFWIWTVERFEDSSFYNGQEYNPVEIARSLDDLLINTNIE